MGARGDLLRRCFWRLDRYRTHGLFVCRFYKDGAVYYVVVDDRLPARARDGRPVFAQCKEPSELWVPLIEKAYAKLHGCYQALIGGFTHNALGGTAE